MEAFSISQLGQYTGVKPHTIRAWEKRYNALRPARSKGNTRYYDGSQMRRVLNIVGLIRAGYKVSELCILPDDQLIRLLDGFYHTAGNETEEYFISQLIAAGLTYDELYFDQVFTRCIACYQLKTAYTLVLLPMLNRIGLMWKCNKASVAHEHFISNILRQKLLTAVDAVPRSARGHQKWLLFLPENEYHEIGLLMAYNLLRLCSHQAIYLGANLPRRVLHAAIRQIAPDNLFIFLVNRNHSKSLKSYLLELERAFRGDIYVANDSSYSLGRTTAVKRIKWLRTIDDLTAVLTSA